MKAKLGYLLSDIEAFSFLGVVGALFAWIVFLITPLDLYASVVNCKILSDIS